MLQQEATESTRLIAAIFPPAEFPYYGYLSALLEKEAYDYGYNLMLCGSLFDREKKRNAIVICVKSESAASFLEATPMTQRC